MSTPTEFNKASIDAGKFPPDAQAKLLARGDADWQKESGLSADGKFGSKSKTAWEAQHAPAGDLVPPRTKAQHIAFYGKLPYTEGEKGRINVDPAWKRNNIVTVHLHTGQRARLHRKIAAAFVATYEAACKASGYTPKSVQTFVTRHQGWDIKRDLSEHSYGGAVDFDPTRNAMRGIDKADGGPSMLRKHMAFVEVFKAAGWTWGGDWKMKDDMHFQFG